MPRRITREASNDGQFDELGVRVCARLPKGFPDQWRDLQLRVGVGLILTEWSGINRSFFDAYAVSSVEDAVATMMRDDSSFLTYQFFVQGVYPAFEWDADWPIWRRRDSPIVKRPMAQGREPWSWQADRTLFDIRREPLSPYTGRLYLRVGGRAQADATRIWNECALTLRSLYRKSARDLKSMPYQVPSSTAYIQLPTGTPVVKREVK